MPSRTNRLLDGFSPNLREDLFHVARQVDLPSGSVLYKPGEPAQALYFLTAGFASVFVAAKDGGTAEVSEAGVDAVPGAMSLLGTQAPVSQCVLQIAGSALCLRMADARRLFAENAEFRDCMLQYIQAECYVTAQIAGCNKLHQAPERVARWLLTAADQSGNETLSLTQESLSQLLGTRRTTIALVAGEMQRKGMLQYRRGRVRIANREALTAAACDCYAITRRLMDFAHPVQ